MSIKTNSYASIDAMMKLAQITGHQDQASDLVAERIHEIVKEYGEAAVRTGIFKALKNLNQQHETLSLNIERE